MPHVRFWPKRTFCFWIGQRNSGPRRRAVAMSAFDPLRTFTRFELPQSRCYVCLKSCDGPFNV